MRKPAGYFLGEFPKSVGKIIAFSFFALATCAASAAMAEGLPAALEGEWIDKQTGDIFRIEKGGAWFHPTRGRGKIREADDTADIKIFYDGGDRCSYRLALLDNGNTLSLTPADNLQNSDYCPSGMLTRVGPAKTVAAGAPQPGASSAAALRGMIPFGQFKDSLRTARLQQYLGAPESRIASEQAFEEIRQYLVNYYAGMNSERGFTDDNGSVFDCVPIEQQPSLQGQSLPSVTPPDLPGASESGSIGEKGAALIPLLNEGSVDQFGNKMLCPQGTIPLLRITIENIGRLGSLQKFFSKSPYESGYPSLRSGEQTQPTVEATHRWAHAFQGVSNLGGHSFLNVWNPGIGSNQVFSLSQHWYTAGSGDNLQTAEVGWQVFPELYKNTKPVFFIFWTADNYKKAKCYNLTCKGFVQTNNRWHIGGAISPSSVSGGAQYEIEVSFFLHQGRWWLYVGGGAASNAIGYYPASIYGNGALASGASGVDYGGETVGSTSWPAMGGGAFANAGWQRAAFHKDIRYFPSQGGNVSARLTGAAATPQCYTVDVKPLTAPWNSTIWFGGPGGDKC
jgi:hypothetical protein